MNTESKSNGTGGASRLEWKGQLDSPWRVSRQIGKSMRLAHGSVQNILISRLNRPLVVKDTFFEANLWINANLYCYIF